MLRGESGACGLSSVLEALAAQYRPALRRTEGHRSFFSALGTVGPSLCFGIRMSAGRTSALRHRSQHSNTFPFAVLTALGLVLELLVVEEKLFARREHEIRATIDAL